MTDAAKERFRVALQVALDDFNEEAWDDALDQIAVAADALEDLKLAALVAVEDWGFMEEMERV